MSIEPTSALTFDRLLLETAREMGVAFYGEDGDEPAQVPVDEHDLSECQRHVNNAVRMFISDAPPTGWRWTRPVAEVAVWPAVSVDATKTVTGGTYDPDNDQTLITANTSVFYESMEEKSIVVTGQGTVVVKRYVSATQVYVYGNHGFAAASTYSIASDGNYTLPRTFAGAHDGQITFAANTNRAVSPQWTDEASIRGWREDVNTNTGPPFAFAPAVFVGQEERRRYMLLAYPNPQEVFTVLFPFDVSFNDMVDGDETPPTPLIHDETIRAACIAVVERDVDDTTGPKMAYYKERLMASQAADMRSAPRKLGYFGNGRGTVTMDNFRRLMTRPIVRYNTP